MMNEPLLLYIETATEICSVAIAQGTTLLSTAECEEGTNHAQNLTPFIAQVLQEAGVERQALQAVALSEGPGSYTGLRIGAATAKGICYGLNIPLITISTLQCIVVGALQDSALPKTDLFIPMIDARRMEVYSAIFDCQGNRISDIEAVIVDEKSYADLLQESTIVFCGNGSAKCQPLYATFARAYFSTVSLSAKNMIAPALEKYRHAQFEDIAYMEPFYLKAFVAAPARVKGLL